MKKTIAQQLEIINFPFEIKDKDGNVIYLEFPNDIWIKYKHDSNGNIIFYQDSFGFCYKRECDSDGKERYYEDSNGKIIDNRPKEIITVNGIKYQRIKG